MAIETFGNSGDEHAHGPPRIDLTATGLTDVPFRHDRRWILRFEAGVLLDLHLRRLARVSGGTDRALALRLRRLQRNRGFLALGYSGFGDYVRERVGISVRSAQELVRLAGGLERLPLLDASLAGGRMTWTAAAQVARVAGVADEAAWVRWGESLSVRQLKKMVADFLETGGDSKSPLGARPDGVQPWAEEPIGTCDKEEEDALVGMAVETSRGTAMLWQAALDLCDLLAGGDLTEGEGAEYILADSLSGLDPVPDDADAERWEPIPTRHPRRAIERVGVPGAPFGIADEPAGELGPRMLPRFLREEAERVLSSLGDIDASIPDDPFRLDESLRRIVGARGSIELDLARLLRNFQSLRLHLHLGFESFDAYVDERLGISGSRARWLARLDRRLFRFIRITAAVREGRIGTVAAMLLCRVAVSGESESAWVQRATERAVRRLREEVAWVERQMLLGRRHGSMPPLERRLETSLEGLSRELRAHGLVEPIKGRAVDGARNRPSDSAGSWKTFACSPGAHPHDFENPSCGGTGVGPADSGHEWETFAHSPGLVTETKTGTRADPVDLGREWETFAHSPGLEAEAHAGARANSADFGREWETFARSTDGDRLRETLYSTAVGPGRGCGARVEFSLRESAVGLWQAARSRIKRATGRRDLSQGDVLLHTAVEFLCTYLPLWFEELRHGDPIAVRERYRCGIPGCSSRGGSGHHLRYRSQGGSDDPENLLFVCYSHHIEGVHRGRLRVHGKAPDQLVVELGIRPDGTALETFVDDVRQSGRAERITETIPVTRTG